ncbi:sterol desaturase family protein [Algiphilus sp.]|uniref:sterol desaturase family protein n=1 Tax=Algiphilus sp. TaxID=1872431 RepID=UPI003B529167
MIGFPIGLLAANAFEWYAHKTWLHEYPAKHRNSPFFTHIRHHKRARTNAFHDEGYVNSMWRDQEMFNEKIALIGLAAATTVVAPMAPFFTLGTWYGAWKYWSVHSKCHLDPDYARNRIPWHYDHHMNASQDANWCVTRPWFDYIMGTRVISDSSVAETNPLGMRLPAIVEKPVNRIARRLLPKSYARIAQRSLEDAVKREQGVTLAVADVA